MRFLDCHYNVLGDRALHEWQFANIFGQGDQLTASMAKRTDSMCLEAHRVIRMRAAKRSPGQPWRTDLNCVATNSGLALVAFVDEANAVTPWAMGT
jgi:hypothetical protein